MAKRPATGTQRKPSRTPVPRTLHAPVPAPSDSSPSGVRRQQALGHERTRRAHAQETSEDYVEAIADLIAGVGEARVTDLAECLGVTHVTVVRTIARLQRDGLVTARPYRSIFLTNEGKRLAERVARRHAIVLEFLRALGVSEDVARCDTEGIEHHVSAQTLAALEALTARLRR